MSVPGIVRDTLGDEDVAARVPLGGDDALFVTPTRTLIYRAEGLLSDESVDEYPHDADRLELSQGRRKTKFVMDYSLEDQKAFTIPDKHASEALHPILAGILSASGVTEPGETVNQTYRFSEMTIVITSRRLVKHIGQAVWDDDYEEYEYEDATGLSFEEGNVATQVVLEIEGRPMRIKAPNDQARDVRERLTQALCSYYEVDTEAELDAAMRPEEESDDDETDADDFGEGVDPLGVDGADADDDATAAANPAEATNDGRRAEGAVAAGATAQHGSGSTATETAENESADSFDAAGFESATPDQPDLREEVADLRETVEHQTELIERQQRKIDQLIEELKRGR